MRCVSLLPLLGQAASFRRWTSSDPFVEFWLRQYVNHVERTLKDSKPEVVIERIGDMARDYPRFVTKLLVENSRFSVALLFYLLLVNVACCCVVVVVL